LLVALHGEEFREKKAALISKYADRSHIKIWEWMVWYGLAGMSVIDEGQFPDVMMFTLLSFSLKLPQRAFGSTAPMTKLVLSASHAVLLEVSRA